MNNMTSEKLIYAIAVITEILGKQVTHIEFEDGSGRSFNYKDATSDKWQYIHLNNLFNNQNNEL